MERTKRVREHRSTVFRAKCAVIRKSYPYIMRILITMSICYGGELALPSLRFT